MATRIALSLLLGATLTASLPALAAKPEVLVEFEIAVADFTESLPGVEQAKRELSEAFAGELQEHFRFARWLTQAPAQADLQIGRLVVRLEQDPDTPEILVRFWGARTGGGLRDLHLPTAQIYSPGNPNWDTNNRAAFKARVLGRTMDKVRNDAFRDKLFEQFLGQLPIATAVEPRAAERVIEIPVRWSEVLLSSESELLIKIDKPAPAGGSLKGAMRLGRIVARIDGQADAPPTFPARLRGSITVADFNGSPVPLNPQNWNDEVMGLLTGAKTDCFISKYQPWDDLADDQDRLGL